MEKSNILTVDYPKEIKITQKSEIKYIQKYPNWYFITKKGNVKTIVNKITKQSNLKWKVSLEMKSTIKVKLK